VLALVAAGSTNREIGQALFLSEATVKSHLVHIFTKLGVGSRTAAVAKARELGAIRAG
jgi:ATP/maltotriose-dependent transcriptional regulator MalT